MEIEKCKYRMTCELGACGNRAEYSVKFAKAGTKSNLNVCADCLKELATPHNMADWCEPDTLLAEQFYGFYYDSLIADSSEHLRQLLRGGLLQRYAIDKLNNRHDAADKCFEFINSSEVLKYDFAEWIKKGKKK